jgi:hypothetical protein
MEIALENKLFYYYILPTARIVINTRKGSTPESRMTFPTGLVMGECKKLCGRRVKCSGIDSKIFCS